MKTKRVFLKCRFGDHLPNSHKSVDLDVKSADYLIAEGLAVEAEESTNIGNTELEGQIKTLTARNAELEARNAELEGQLALLSPTTTEKPKGK